MARKDLFRCEEKAAFLNQAVAAKPFLYGAIEPGFLLNWRFAKILDQSQAEV